MLKGIKKKELTHCQLFLAGLAGFEPAECWSQSPVPYHLAIAQKIWGG